MRFPIELEKQQDVLRLAQVHVSVSRHTIDNDFNSHSCCDKDPIETTKKLLESSFFTALKEIYMYKIKKIIEREW